MVVYLLKKTIYSLFLLLCFFSLLFVLIRLAPGNPYDTEIAWTSTQKALLSQQNPSLWIQWKDWVQNLATGNLGASLLYPEQSVKAILSKAMPISFTLGLGALCLSFFLGTTLGVLHSHFQNSFYPTKKNYKILIQLFFYSATLGVSIPSYLVASLCILIFSIQLKWLPPALWEGASSAILPLLTLSWRPLGLFAQITHSSLNQVLHENYIRTAFAKGLPLRKILLQHALRNSLIPILSSLGSMAGALLCGSFLVETLFQIPGLGQYFVLSILNRDYPVVMGIAGTFGILLIGSHLVIEVLLGCVDPRISMAKT